MNKKVYVGMVADLLHDGHLNIIKEAAQYGDVIIGLFTDEAAAMYKRIPFLTYDQRKLILESLKDVAQVVPQTTADYRPNLRKYKPDYIIHGDDWKTGVLATVRQGVIDVLDEWGGQLIEIPYTQNVSSTQLHDAVRNIKQSPVYRYNRFHRTIEAKPLSRGVVVRDELTARQADLLSIKENGRLFEYDFLVFSNRGSKGFDETLVTLNNIMDVTEKPVIYGGNYPDSEQDRGKWLRTLNRMGLSGVWVRNDEKIFPLLEMIKNEMNTEVCDIYVSLSLKNFSANTADYARKLMHYQNSGIQGGFLNSPVDSVEYIDIKKIMPEKSIRNFYIGLFEKRERVFFQNSLLSGLSMIVFDNIPESDERTIVDVLRSNLLNDMSIRGK